MVCPDLKGCKSEPLLLLNRETVARRRSYRSKLVVKGLRRCKDVIPEVGNLKLFCFASVLTQIMQLSLGCFASDHRYLLIGCLSISMRRHCTKPLLRRPSDLNMHHVTPVHMCKTCTTGPATPHMLRTTTRKTSGWRSVIACQHAKQKGRPAQYSTRKQCPRLGSQTGYAGLRNHEIIASLHCSHLHFGISQGHVSRSHAASLQRSFALTRSKLPAEDPQQPQGANLRWESPIGCFLCRSPPVPRHRMSPKHCCLGQTRITAAPAGLHQTAWWARRTWL